ncbi:MAG TPA: radical SAM protein [Granulicella sp.]
MPDSHELFPILPSPLKGLAKSAAEAEHADDGHLIEFRALKVRSILNWSVSKRRVWMAYSINPYRGCEFGCRYCYARYTHEFLAPKEGTEMEGSIDLRDPEVFERVIFIKQNAAWLLEQELRKIDPEDQIALGTATDPYQPIERRARVTRSLLEVFARQQGLRLGIITKSRLIERDIDLLAEIGRRNSVVVHVTITTTDAELARRLEPRAPRPDLRFQAVERLRAAGVVAGVMCSPLLPGITDTAEALDRVAKRAAEVKASFFVANPLFLKPCSRPTYFQFVEEHFPALMGAYAKQYDSADFVSGSYRRNIAAMVEAARQRHGLTPRSMEALLHEKKTPEAVRIPKQQKLFG